MRIERQQAGPAAQVVQRILDVTGRQRADPPQVESTVKTHVTRIMAKLALRDRAHAVIYGYETGLVRPGDASRDRPTLAWRVLTPAPGHCPAAHLAGDCLPFVCGDDEGLRGDGG
jgi:hypothetical protein